MESLFFPCFRVKVYRYIDYLACQEYRASKVYIYTRVNIYDMYDIINYGTMICMILLIMVL